MHSHDCSSDTPTILFMTPEVKDVIDVCAENLVRFALEHVLTSADHGEVVSSVGTMSVASMEKALALRGVNIAHETSIAVLAILYDLSEPHTKQELYSVCSNRFAGGLNPLLPAIETVLREEKQS